ncbi:hypothetical protein GCM10023231_24530 [Olivibacter ginsenosidimutans]|uniref:GxGYxYP putative glycoside hydrolase C-terminal domain-containing protein n=1 Tax=Olivibacter ginsenosidimutans TaxID=1176537 RepID=A0ABP9BGL8_9SPHI
MKIEIKKIALIWAIAALSINLAGTELQAQTLSDKLTGTWRLVKDSSNYLPYFSGCELILKQKQDSLSVSWKWMSKEPHIDAYVVPLNGKKQPYAIHNRVWPYENFMGVNYVPGTKGSAAYVAGNGPLSFAIQNQYPVKVSQGVMEMEHRNAYQLSPDGHNLQVLHYRKGRSEPTRYYFAKIGAKKAYVHQMKNDWKLKGGVADNAFFVSLQGLVNREKAQLYLDYPADWEYKESNSLRGFYERRLDYDFEQLASADQALAQFAEQLKGYIVWDRDSRSSLCVAFTVAGLEDAVVVTPDMVPLMQKYKLPLVKDFSGQFNGQSDEAIFRWAYQTYAPRCSKDYIVWMGGNTGDQIMPGIADFGVAKKAFFADLSTDPQAKGEYYLADSIMACMKPFAMVMGWHSYGKDLERNYVTLTSSHGLRVEGLNTFPNLSFTSMTPPSPDFKFKNNHQLVPGKKYTPEKKVYITCVQTDGLGLGSWNSPKRGSIPYAWEVTINWYWLAPVLLQYYYENATPNDYFFGSLSGPGYLYPKAIPEKLFEPMMHIADTLCKKLDLNVFETMDYSEGSSGVGNNDLPKKLVEKYFKAMPDIIGMLNGYAPSYTFGKVSGKPFISYDYYLDENMPEADVIDDLNELITLNATKPYFLALHVREWNDIDRVQRILSKLKGETEVVPLDIFLKMAAESDTYKTYYLPEK